MPEPLSPVLWQKSAKFDGSLHYRFPVTLVQKSRECLVAYSGPGAPIESYRGSWARTKHVLSHFWRERSYVLHVEWDTQWKPDFLYVDITTGVEWDDETVRFIDLDLDLIRRHGSATTILDDEDEFEEHRLLWKYPDELVRQCWRSVEEVRQLLDSESPPFSPSTFAWRPAR